MTIQQAKRCTATFLLTAALAIVACDSRAPADTQAASPAEVSAEEASARAFLDDVQKLFNEDGLDTFMEVFTDDAVISAAGSADAVGKPAIRKVYEDALAQNGLKVKFTTEELLVSGDLAYERGTYVIEVSSLEDGKVIANVTNRHIHILRKQADGSWKTWRMMTNSAAPAGPP